MDKHLFSNGHMSEMARRIQQYDWAKTPLGPLVSWPASLRTMTAMIIENRFPMALWWGPELRHIHNDAYLPVLGDKQTWALAQPAAEVWQEVWQDNVKAQADYVMEGKGATWNVKKKMLLNRKGYPEEAYFDFSYSPVRDDNGAIGGVLVTCRDTTLQVRFEQKGERELLQKTKQGEERLLALMRATSDVIYRMSPDWKTMAELYGRGFLADTEKPDSNWMDKYIHPDDQEYVTHVIESCIQDKRMFELEHRVLRADGSIGWTYSRAVPLLQEDGTIREWFGAASDITGHKRAEEALRESEAKYHNLFDSIDEGYCIIEVLFDDYDLPLDYRYLEVNKSFEKQTGIANATGRLMRVIAPDHEQHWFDIYGHIALTGEPARFQNPAKALVHFYDVYAYRVGTPEQRRVAILFNDITERKKDADMQLEKTGHLEDANRQKNDILESISDCFYVLDRELCFTYVNKAAEEIWGIPRANLLGRRIGDVFPGLIDTSLSMFRQALEEKSLQHDEVFSNVIGRWGDMIAVPTQDGISVNFRDTTERKQAEEVLRKHEKRQAYLLKLSDALRTLSGANSIQEAATRLLADHLGASQSSYTDYSENYVTIQCEAQNDQKLSMKGTYQRSVMSAGIDILCSGKDLVFADVDEYTEVPEELRALWASMNIRANATVPIFRENKLVAMLSVMQTTPRFWLQDEVELVHETAECTWLAIERAKAEEARKESEARALALVKELEEADRNKNQFISALSHELRNPLAIIVTGIELLGIAEDKKQLDTTKDILNRQVKQLCALVDDLLDLTRITNNRIVLKKERVELNQLACITAEDQQGLFLGKGIGLHTRTGAIPLYLDADPVRLKQIIGNLLHNALKYTKAGGETILSVFEEGGEAIISVKDNGIGLSPDIIPCLFQPFVQADTSLDRSSGGLGLGLSITKGIAEMHGGSVSAFSGGLGKGSEFVIRLPLCHEEGSAGVLEERQPDTAARPLKILIVEDNRDFAGFLSRMLAQMGFKAEAAYDGHEGLHKAKKIRPDMIFCDIGLPGINGYDVIKHIKEIDELKNTYLVALTGYAGEADVKRAKESGFDRHLAKPVSFTSLKQIINNHPAAKGIL